MLKRVLSITGVAVVLTATVAAAGLSESLQTSRMTVLKVDRAGGRFLCVEHQKWGSVARTDLSGVGPGDIVRVTRQDGKPARLVVLRTAADELSSVER
jgi:hypothetical protein